MIRPTQPPSSTTGGQQRLTNALALLALVAIGVVWPPLELTDTHHGTTAARRGIVMPPQAVAQRPTDAQRQADAIRAAAAAAPRRASLRDAAARARSCVPEDPGRAGAAAPAPATIGPPRA
jgi:hypothetical protein